MSQDPATELGATLLRALREASPANATPVPRWRRIEAEAALRGFSSTRALRDWCLRRDVPLREDSYRDTWVSPQAIDEAVERLPRAEPTARQLGARAAADAETESDARESLGLPR